MGALEEFLEKEAELWEMAAERRERLEELWECDQVEKMVHYPRETTATKGQGLCTSAGLLSSFDQNSQPLLDPSSFSTRLCCKVRFHGGS